jgi:hypothetical protein
LNRRIFAYSSLRSLSELRVLRTIFEAAKHGPVFAFSFSPVQ